MKHETRNAKRETRNGEKGAGEPGRWTALVSALQVGVVTGAVLVVGSAAARRSAGPYVVAGMGVGAAWLLMPRVVV